MSGAARQTMKVSEVAELLTAAAQEVGLAAFADLAASVLEDNSPGEIAAIGAFMPDALRDLLPRRTLH